MNNRYTLGLDFGTNTVRALLVRVSDGAEVASAVFGYPHGENGILTDPNDPNLARQHPADYLAGIEYTVPTVLKEAAASVPGFAPEQVVGIGVDTTGSTPVPVDTNGTALALTERFANRPAAMAWLWKDHTSHQEALEITELAERIRPQYLAKCGGRYSSEWFWSKVLHAARVAPDVYEAAASWVEIADWIPAVLCGTTDLASMKRGVCPAGHKAMYHRMWGGYPDEDFLAELDPRLVALRQGLPDMAYSIAEAAGHLSEEWAARLGLPAGIPVAVGALDAHLGAVGSGIVPGALVKILGTSTCDLIVAPLSADLPDVPGLCGIVPESVLPHHYGLEAGQSAVGDIFAWFTDVVKPGGPEAGSHKALTEGASQLKPGESGLLALDWHNGNRTILVDQRLTGLLVGMHLHTTPAEIYRALVEATAFGARVIAERFEEYGVRVDRVINCGGIAAKNPVVMQIYADVLNKPMQISASDQTCALGSALAAAVVAGEHPDFETAMAAMTSVKDEVYQPNPENAAVYNRLFAIYRSLHDAFGRPNAPQDLYPVMKDLLNIRDSVMGL